MIVKLRKAMFQGIFYPIIFYPIMFGQKFSHIFINVGNDHNTIMFDKKLTFSAFRDKTRMMFRFIKKKILRKKNGYSSV